MKKFFTLIVMACLAMSANAQQPVLKMKAKGQWASYTFNSESFKAADYKGFRIEYSDMSGTDAQGGNETALFNILINSEETHLGKDWSGADAQVPNKTAYKNEGFTPENNVFEGDFADFVETGNADTTCPTIGQFALQSCQKDNEVTIIKVVFIKNDGTEVFPTYKGDDWGGGAYEVEEVTGIGSVKADKMNGVRYNLAGQKVDAAYKGVVIMNGKKMVVK